MDRIDGMEMTILEILSILSKIPYPCALDQEHAW